MEQWNIPSVILSRESTYCLNVGGLPLVNWIRLIISFVFGSKTSPV